MCLHSLHQTHPMHKFTLEFTFNRFVHPIERMRSRLMHPMHPKPVHSHATSKAWFHSHPRVARGTRTLTKSGKRFCLQMLQWWTARALWAAVTETGAVDCAVNGPWNGVRGAVTDPVPSRAATTRRTYVMPLVPPRPRPLEEALEARARFSHPSWRTSMEVSDDIIDIWCHDREPWARRKVSRI